MSSEDGDCSDDEYGTMVIRDDADLPQDELDQLDEISRQVFDNIQTKKRKTRSIRDVFGKEWQPTTSASRAGSSMDLMGLETSGGAGNDDDGPYALMGEATELLAIAELDTARASLRHSLGPRTWSTHSLPAAPTQLLPSDPTCGDEGNDEDVQAENLAQQAMMVEPREEGSSSMGQDLGFRQQHPLVTDVRRPSATSSSSSQAPPRAAPLRRSSSAAVLHSLSSFGSDVDGASHIDMTGQVCIVTGANTGLGLATARQLAAYGATVVMACRNVNAGDNAAKQIAQADASIKSRLHVMHLDLGVLRTVRAFADAFSQQFSSCDVLINNASVLLPTRHLTEDGHETTFATNHLGSFLLTHLLLPALRASAPSRVINVSCPQHTWASSGFLDDLNWSHSEYDGQMAYNNSKLCALWFTFELARRCYGSGVYVNCVSPGYVYSELTRSLPWWQKMVLTPVNWIMARRPDEAAATQVFLAADPRAASLNGRYLVDCALAAPSQASMDVRMQKRLWEISMRAVGVYLRPRYEQDKLRATKDWGRVDLIQSYRGSRNVAAMQQQQPGPLRRS